MAGHSHSSSDLLLLRKLVSIKQQQLHNEQAAAAAAVSGCGGERLRRQATPAGPIATFFDVRGARLYSFEKLAPESLIQKVTEIQSKVSWSRRNFEQIDQRLINQRTDTAQQVANQTYYSKKLSL